MTAPNVDPQEPTKSVVNDDESSTPDGIWMWPIGWLIAIIIAWLYLRSQTTISVPSIDHGIPAVALWFGALGGVAGSLHGIFIHNADWDKSYDLWHKLAPLMGAIYGLVGFLFIVVIAKTASGTTGTDGTVFALGGFALGYSQIQFGNLMTKVFEVLFQPAKN